MGRVGRFDSFYREWSKFSSYARQNGHNLPSGGQYSGRLLAKYMRFRDTAARLRFRSRHAGGEIPAGSAQGRTAKGGVGSILRTLGSKLHFPVDVTSLTA